jgi:hypothetical protein
MMEVVVHADALEDLLLVFSLAAAALVPSLRRSRRRLPPQLSLVVGSG